MLIEWCFYNFSQPFSAFLLFDKMAKINFQQKKQVAFALSLLSDFFYLVQACTSFLQVY